MAGRPSVDHCVVRSFESGIERVIDRPVRKSVFRAILARVATLCSERVPNLVSHYGGQAEFPLSAGSDMFLKVAFTNTSSEQRLKVTPVPIETAGGEAATMNDEPDSHWLQVIKENMVLAKNGQLRIAEKHGHIGDELIVHCKGNSHCTLRGNEARITRHFLIVIRNNYESEQSSEYVTWEDILTIVFRRKSPENQ
jgi:hypothetical protein